MQQKAIKFNTKSFRETLKLYGLTVSEANALTGKKSSFLGEPFAHRKS
jgi:hypothetical protein